MNDVQKRFKFIDKIPLYLDNMLKYSLKLKYSSQLRLNQRSITKIH